MLCFHHYWENWQGTNLHINWGTKRETLITTQLRFDKKQFEDNRRGLRCVVFCFFDLNYLSKLCKVIGNILVYPLLLPLDQTCVDAGYSCPSTICLDWLVLNVTCTQICNGCSNHHMLKQKLNVYPSVVRGGGSVWSKSKTERTLPSFWKHSVAANWQP